jgi:SAM-dependent methyltransferase
MDLSDIRDRWNREAAEFDAIYESPSWAKAWFNRIARRAVFERFSWTLSSMKPSSGATILDVGCGSGVYAVALLDRGAASVTGIDVSESMLALARKRTADHPKGSQATFVLGDLQSWTSPERFDYSLAMGVFDYTSDPAELILKMRSFTTQRLVASFPTNSRLRIRSGLRRMRYSVQRKGDVRYYTLEEVQKLAKLCKPKSVAVKALGGGQGFFLTVDL